MNSQTFAGQTIHLPAWLNSLLKPLLAWQPMLWLMLLISFVIAWNRGLALLYGLFALLLSLLILSYLLPRLILRGIAVQRKFPYELFAGQKCSIEYEIQTRRRARLLTLIDRLPFKAKPKEPLRTFALEAGKHTVIQQTVVCEQRGYYAVDEIGLACAYPFGIVSVTRHLATARNEILVLPKCFEIQNLPYIGAQHHSADGMIVSQRQGSINEFAGIREYRYGDNLKYMHWPATAKYQTPIVREYDGQDKPNILIILDGGAHANIGSGAHSTFEYAIQIAASIITYASRHGYLSQLLVSDQATSEMVIPAFCQDLIPYYEKLALLNADGHVQYDAIVDYAQQRYPQSNLAVTFCNHSTQHQPCVKPSITQLDIQMLDRSFLSGDISNKYADINTKRQGERLSYFVHCGMDLETLFV